ncbi:hypothetical protein [Clostridium ganghwense]|uniref:Uncharacterized protein n=1 Tax=Clostridium ganghwense TaxID=312089 RepID=A0ABT4CL81_9CLOT|nr:hypothetical protein [Clostridium ganghwense]MCY6369802.1 hypothetical protein [Clostridium ganghwense]
MKMNLNHSDINIKKKKISEQIVAWSSSREKYLNVISPPYNSSEIFLNIILNYVYRNKKVLYITDENSIHIEIIEKIKRKSKFRRYTYVKEKSNYNDALLIISKHDMLSKLDDKFDLVIYDDIKSFSSRTNYEIIEAMVSKAKDNAKVISYCIEKTFKNKREILLPVRGNSYPVIEPKFIGTRININKDIPYVAYEYLEWSIKTNQKVMVYVPNEEKVKKVYQYLSVYCSKINRNIISFIKNKNEEKVLYNFMKMKQGIMVTNDFHFDIKNVNVMVFFADDKLFDYKKLVYLCGKVGRSGKSRRGEVVFLGKYETEDMDKAKNITRHFNKEAWEMNLLKI